MSMQEKPHQKVPPLEVVKVISVDQVRDTFNETLKNCSFSACLKPVESCGINYDGIRVT